MNPVMPRQRVTSACRMSTAPPASSARVVQIVAVLARRDRHPGRCMLAHEPQPREVVRRHRLLEVAHAVRREQLRHRERLLRRVRAVRIGHQLDIRPRRRARRPHALAIELAIAPDLQLHPPVTRRDVARDLGRQLVGRRRREAAARVHRHARARAAEELGERHVEQARLQVPQRDVDRRDRARDHAGAPVVAHRLQHARRERRDRERIRADQARLEQVAHDRRRGSVDVAVAEPARAARVQLDDDERRRIPCGGAVGLGAAHRRDPAHAQGDPLYVAVTLAHICFAACLMTRHRCGSPCTSADISLFA